MQSALLSLLLVAIVPCFCQRPFYAGLRPIDYSAISPTPEQNEPGNDLPPQLNGDIEYAKRLDKLPVDQQPFWYINRQQYQQQPPQTYPQRPSIFNDPVKRSYY